MEFFDKKQDVINLQLTRCGRQLLSIGEFQPVYYSFSDDGIVYDNRWISGTTAKEEQWLVERRIQEETPRIETLNSKVGTERTIFNTADLSSYALDQNIIDLFNLGNDLQDLAELEEYKSGKLKLDPDWADSEKLLINLLGTKRYFNNKAPSWNTLYYNGTLSSSSNIYQKNGITAPIPQLNSNIIDKIYRVPDDLNIFTTEPSLIKLSEMNLADVPAIDGDDEDWTGGDDPGDLDYWDGFDEFVSENSLATGSIVIENDYLFISIEEANVDFENENFILEVYEITDTGGLQNLRKMIFGDPIGTGVYDVLDLQVDEEIDVEVACYNINNARKLKTKNIYTANVFDCEDGDIGHASLGSPYDLPPVDAQDVC